MIAEIGLDMYPFSIERNLATWIRISLGNKESAGKNLTTNENKQVKSIVTETT